MVIKGIVHNGQIQIENTVLPDGTRVVITPVQPSTSGDENGQVLKSLKASIQRIAALPCENVAAEDFSGADHDRVLYGN